MNIFEYAIQMEKDGEALYHQLSAKITNQGLKTIFTMLANDEVKHRKALEQMQRSEVEMTETTILDDAKNIFLQIQETDEGFVFDHSQIELYRKAQDIEQKSCDFYLEKANEVEHEYQYELFYRLAEEEKKHYYLLDNVIEFVSRPEQWLENAEFYHLEEY